jgi:hypothetical protein
MNPPLNLPPGYKIERLMLWKDNGNGTLELIDPHGQSLIEAAWQHYGFEGA